MKPFHWSLILLAFSVLSCGDDPTPPGLDTTPPARITDFSATVEEDLITLRWTAPGDNNMIGRAFRYDIRYAGTDLVGTWDSAAMVGNPPTPSEPGQPDSLMTPGIPPGAWEVGIRTRDVAGNWSSVSNTVFLTLEPDTIPPATIGDLAVRSTIQGFYLSWTAPGDDGQEGRSAGYEIRYASGNLGSQWESGVVVADPPPPSQAGQTDSTAVLGIGWGPWEFGVRCVDDAGNWSGTSNIVTTTVPGDVIPPAAVTDLAVDFLTERSVVLVWTAVGDDGGTGQAAEYDLRYALAPITEETWAAATRVQGMSAPLSAGEREKFTVGELQKQLTYHFALRVLDEVGNASEVSSEITRSLPSPVQLTFSTDIDSPVSSPDWSPDGKSIAFLRQSGESSSQVLVMPASGGTAVAYTPTSSHATFPSWSPDGSQLVIAMNDSLLVVMDAQPNAPAQVMAVHAPLWVSWPRWSPDGTRFFYIVRDVFQPALNSEMYALSLSGGPPELLRNDSRHSGLDVSPDGSQVVYSSRAAGTDDLWLMPSTGGAAMRITSDPGRELHPAWSPDGTKIAYDDREEIWVIDSTGQNPTQVTFDPEYVPLRITWSPDASAIAFDLVYLPTQVVNVWRMQVR